MYAVQADVSTPAREKEASILVVMAFITALEHYAVKRSSISPKNSQIRLEMFTVYHRQDAARNLSQNKLATGFVAALFNQPIPTCQSGAFLFSFFFLDTDGEPLQSQTRAADDVLCCNSSQTLPVAAILSATVRKH